MGKRTELSDEVHQQAADEIWEWIFELNRIKGEHNKTST